MSITIKQVAEYAEVSPSSVSRYMNNSHSIKPIPALRIEKAIKDLGYIPNSVAQGLKRGQSNMIGVVVPRLGPFYVSICTALSDFFYQNNYLLFICETNDNPERERYYINSLIGQQAAGILLAPSGRNEDFLQDIQNRYLHILLLDHYNETLPFDCVYENNEESSYELVKFMIAQGHRQYILLFHNEYASNMTPRLNGARRAFEEAGIDINSLYIETITGSSSIENPLIKLMSRTPKATAVLAFSPMHLESCLSVFNKLGKRVPADITLGGYVLQDFFDRYQMDLPSVIQAPYELGIRAGDILLKRLKKSRDRTTPKRYQLKTRLHLL